MREVTYAQAINEALHEEMAADSSVLVMGEDIHLPTFGPVHDGLLQRFGPLRVRSTPLSETAIIGAAVGAALTGLRPVVEIMLADFVAVCFDEIHNKAGKWMYMHGGRVSVPLVIRTPGGAQGGGAEHSQSTEGLFVGSPGLKIALPSTPADAKGLLKAAIRDDDPVLFFEHKRLYDVRGPVPEGDGAIPLGQAAVRRPGTDVSIIATSYQTVLALDAAEDLAGDGISAEVIDLRTLVPLDKHTVLTSVAKTGRAVIVHEPNKRGGPGAEIAAVICELGFGYLRSPIVRVAPPDVPIPFTPALEKLYLPDRQTIVEAVKGLL